MAKLDATFLKETHPSGFRTSVHRTNYRKIKGYRELVGSTLNSTYSKDNQELIRVSFSSCKSCSIIIKVIYVVANPVHGLLDRNVPYVMLRYSYLWQEQ